MSETQGYKKGQEFTFLTDVERANIIVALEDRKDELRARIKELDDAQWTDSASKARTDLEAVKDLLKRLGVQ